jgi:uncharacterized protein (TIGR03067 family)
MRSISFKLVLPTLLILGLACQPASALTKAPKPPEEQLFLLYVLEDFYRDTWADVDSDSVRDAHRFEVFVARQKTLADDLRRHIEKAKLGDDLADLYYAYRKLLDKAEATGALEGLKRLQDELIWKKKRDLRRQWAAKVNARKLAAAERTAAVTLDSTTRGDLFSGLFAALTTAVFEGVRVRRASAQAWQEAEQDWKDYWKKTAPIYKARVQEKMTEFIDAVKGLRRKCCEAARKKARELAQARGWNGKGDLFDALTPLIDSSAHQRPGDPLRAARLLKMRKVAEGRAAVKMRINKAKEYLEAAKLVPRQREYNFVRANLYRAAGEEANLASAEQLGSASFARGTPTDAGKVGVQAWNQYYSYQRKDRIDGPTLHQIILAYAYNGQWTRAYQILAVSRPLWPADRAFLYDAARICSLVAETRLRGLAAYGAVLDSARLFKFAVLAGYQDLKGAGEVRDLERLRVVHKAWFEALVNREEPPPLEDDEKIQGTWQGVTMEDRGKRRDIKGFQVIFAGENFTVTSNGKVNFKGTFKLDPAKRPKTLDRHLDDGKTSLGIYELKGNELRWCNASPGSKRPKNFNTRGTTHFMVIFRKVK